MNRIATAANARRMRQTTARHLPPYSPWWFRNFSRYVRWYLRRNFHTLRLTCEGAPRMSGGRPAVIFMNHPGWWDPLVGLSLGSMLMADRRHHAPIDAAALQKYRIFEKIGFFGIEPGSTRGGIRFLRTADAVLAEPAAVLWMTPEGEFTDPRRRPVKLQPGLSRLAARVEHADLLPLAVEYPFWQERYPEALAHFGPPIRVEDFPGDTPEDWARRLTAALCAAQDRLAELAVARREHDFQVLLRGNAGIGGVYDFWRRIKSYCRGRRFHSEHAAPATGDRRS